MAPHNADVFVAFVPTGRHGGFSHANITKALSTRLTETYRLSGGCLDNATSVVLTFPFIPVTSPFDNEHNELIVRKGDRLGSYSSIEGMRCSMHQTTATQYVVHDALGKGTFGQVFRCYDVVADRFVALKVLRNKTAYFRQGLLEIASLTIAQTFQTPTSRPVVHLFDHFLFNGHLCLVFELLGHDLHHIIHSQREFGLPVPTIITYCQQILAGIRVLTDAGIIHCDIKPENILLDISSPPSVKLIDLGSSCFQNYTLYSYIQSRHYRAPEIVFGLPYSSAIDMWSFGCVVAELFLGMPLFPADSEYELVAQFIAVLGLPPFDIIRGGSKTPHFFKVFPSLSRFRLKEVFEYEMEHHITLVKPRFYFDAASLREILLKAPFRVSLYPHNLSILRLCLLDFLSRVLTYSPEDRLTPRQALHHPLFASPLATLTRSDIDAFLPPPRESPFRLSGHSPTSTPQKMLDDAFSSPDTLDASTPIDRSLNNADYYHVFLRLLRAGHVPNITINNPLQTGGITPPQFASLHRPLSTDPPLLPRPKKTTPRIVRLHWPDSSPSPSSDAPSSPAALIAAERTHRSSLTSSRPPQRSSLSRLSSLN